MEKIIYIPLDERQCNYEFPFTVGNAAGLEIIRPPLGIMSKLKQPCDYEKLWQWLNENVSDCSQAIISLDTLVYGSLMHSRHHNITEAECMTRLKRIKELKSINPKIKINAFMLIMRTANHNNNSEEPDYWEEYGQSIWKFSWLSDKKQRVGLTKEEDDELSSLNETIPEFALQDYVNRRQINLKVNCEALKLVYENVIDEFVIPKDDNSEYGFSTRDQDNIYQKIINYEIRDKVYIYPGADEVGCTLVSRAINSIREVVPKIYVYYSSVLGPNIIAKYEDRPIHESIKWQILSAGAMLTDQIDQADLVLAVNTPGKYMIECHEQFKGDYSYNNFRNLDEFIQRLKYFVKSGKRCLIADIAYSNGADNELANLVNKNGLFMDIFAYGAWNTAANTLGVVILQGVAALALNVQNISENKELHQFHTKKIIEDWVYQSNVMLEILKEHMNTSGFNCYKLEAAADYTGNIILEKMNRFITEKLIKNLHMTQLSVNHIVFTWDRLFDVELSIKWDE